MPDFCSLVDRSKLKIADQPAPSFLNSEYKPPGICGTTVNDSDSEEISTPVESVATWADAEVDIKAIRVTESVN